MTVENRAYGDLDTFEEACRRADRQQRRKPDNPRIARARRLLADDVSFERAWYELNCHDGATSSTIEALMFSLRRGVGALAEPATLHRLSELSDEQLREIAVRLQKFKSHIAPAWTAEEVEALIILKSKL
jgi:hypothetical protein